MNTFTDPTDALTVPGDLNAIPWIEIEERCDFSHELSLALCDDDLSFQDTVFLDEFPYWCCATQLTSLDFGISVCK
jgi:hypothetical protein